MRVISICQDDYANFMHANAKALRLAGVDCRDFKLFPHKFQYAEQSTVVGRFEMGQQIKNADLIQIFHSCTKCLQLVEQYGRGKRVIVYHTGTNYRSDPKGMNAIFNPVVDFCMTDQCEFMQLGAKRLIYTATAVDTSALQPGDRPATVPYIVAHYPSNPRVKGSDQINYLMSSMVNRNMGGRYRYLYSTKRVDHKAQIERMQGCDIYIELYALKQNGNDYGCYGVTAFEAAAMGKVVVTQNVFPNVYTEAYGCKLPFVLVHSETDFLRKLSDILLDSNVAVRELQAATRSWLVQNHSYQATGERLKKIIA